MQQILAHPEYFIPLAVLATDLLLGDPQSWTWHPVRLLGRFAAYLEFYCRNRFPLNPQRAGTVAGLLLLLTTIICSVYLTNLLYKLLPPLLYWLACVFLCYFCIAVKDMVKHSRAVLQCLKSSDIEQARKKLAMIVGRDTEYLDEKEISRAAVESVAESFSDSLVAPLFFITLGTLLWGISGAVIGGFTYRAVNTLDSMFGYKNERYIEFGRFSAKIDDVFNFIPARLSIIAVSFGAFFCGFSAKSAFRTALKDGNHHSSPNSGYPEAAFAGALGVQLGGDNYYGGLVRSSAKIGQPLNELAKDTINQANRLYVASAAVFAIACSLFIWI